MSRHAVVVVATLLFACGGGTDAGTDLAAPADTLEVALDVVETSDVVDAAPDAAPEAPAEIPGTDPGLEALDAIDASGDIPAADVVPDANCVSNALTDAKILTCPANATACSNSTGSVTATGSTGIPDAQVCPEDWTLVVVCAENPHGGATLWNFWGNPALSLQGSSPDFLTSRGCDRDPQDVFDVCGSGSNFFCTVDVKPGADAAAGDTSVDLVLHDHDGVTTGMDCSWNEPFKLTVKTPEQCTGT